MRRSKNVYISWKLLFCMKGILIFVLLIFVCSGVFAISGVSPAGYEVEKYVKIGLNAPNVNVGEDVLLEVELFGREGESVIVSSRIEVYKDGKIIEVIDIGDVEVISEKELSVEVFLDTSNYSAGDYLAVAFADYDNRSVSVKNPFRLGEFLVRLVNYTKSFRENEIDRFEILVENLWDDDMGEVYAEVNVLDFDLVNFATPSESLGAWESVVLVGFLDMSKIDGDSFEAEIVLHYDDGSISEIVELDVIMGFDYVFWAVRLVIIVVLVFLVWRWVIFVRRFRDRKIKRV